MNTLNWDAQQVAREVDLVMRDIAGLTQGGGGADESTAYRIFYNKARGVRIEITIAKEVGSHAESV